jgi:hypothetical protein
MAAGRRPSAEMTLPFDSPTSTFRGQFLGIFRLYLTAQKFFQFTDLAGNVAFGFENLGFWAF